MKKATVVLLLMMGILPVFSQSVIKVNQLGYLPEFPKYAWVNDVKGEQVKWYVKNAENDETVFAGTFQSSKHMDRATGEVVNKLDFSKITQPGRYYVEVQNTGRSPLFSIAQDVYDKVWSAGVKSYYYQRSGMDLTPEYAGIWARNATHTRDAVIYLGFSNGKIIGGKHQNCVG